MTSNVLIHPRMFANVSGHIDALVRNTGGHVVFDNGLPYLVQQPSDGNARTDKSTTRQTPENRR